MFAHLGSRTRLATQHALRARRVVPTSPVAFQSRRTFVSEIAGTLSEGFLDLALAIPYPEGVPVYSGTVILLTVATRLVFTVPFSLWVRYSLLLVACGVY